jgi:hypothetical protein
MGRSSRPYGSLLGHNLAELPIMLIAYLARRGTPRTIDDLH